jgi:hypothetical protein
MGILAGGQRKRRRRKKEAAVGCCVKRESKWNTKSDVGFAIIH